MMKKAALLAACIALLVACASSEAQTTLITASNISKFGGAKITGQFCVTPTDSSGNPINLTTPTGQQFAPSTSLCFPIVNGALSAYAIVPDTSLTQPANACYKLTVSDNHGNQIGTYPCIQPSGTSWSFDAYVPSNLPSIFGPLMSLPQFQTNGAANSNQGILNLICTWCTEAAGAVTFPVPTGASIANNTILGNISGAVAAAAGLTPAQTSALLEIGMNDPQMVYVSKEGSNSNDGRSWQTAKLTVAGGVSALPLAGTIGSGGYHYGVINIGPGNFPEVGGLEFNQAIHYLGVQSGLTGISGTTIQLANGANTFLFSESANWDANVGFNHNSTIENVTLDGNKANNTSGGLVNMVGGGYDTYFKNVNFQNSPGYSIYVDQRAVNFECYTCTFGGNALGVYFNETAGGSVVSMIGLQFDNNGGDAAITIAQGTYSPTSMYYFEGVKAESQVAGTQNHIISHINGGSNDLPDQIIVNGGYTFCTASTCDAFAYESSGTGSEARWEISNVQCHQGMTYCFHSAKSGDTLDGSKDIGNLSHSDRTANGMAYPAPDYSLSGGSSIWSYPGTPNSNVTAGPGSISLDATDSEVWVKTGTGNTGWTVLGGFNPASPGAIGGTTPAAGTFSSLSAPAITTQTNGYQSATKYVGTGGITGGKIVYIPAGTGYEVVLPTTAFQYNGIAVSSVASGSTGEIIQFGIGSCTFDNTAVLGDIAIPSSGTLGDCHDSGQTSPAAIQNTIPLIGVVQTTGGQMFLYHAGNVWGQKTYTQPSFSVAGCGTATSLSSTGLQHAGTPGATLAGKFNGGSATCTPVVTTADTAPTGYACNMQDLTTATANFRQSAWTTTTVTFTAEGTVGSADLLTWQCTEF
jgi:hypothetical protein